MLKLPLLILNGFGWGIKPIFEKMAIDKFGAFFFTYIRYAVAGLIAIFLSIIYTQKYGLPTVYKRNNTLFVKDAIFWGGFVGLIALLSSIANYYLLERYPVSYVTPIANGIFLLANVSFSKLVLNEPVSVKSIVGIVLISAGVFFIYD